MPAAGAPTINGLHFKIVFFDFIYMLGEFLGSLYVVPVKRLVDTLLSHTYDSTPVQDMDPFPKEQAVVQLTSALDAKPGETAHKTILELNQAARNLHLYVKKEKLAGVEYLVAGKPVADSQLITQAEAQETDKDIFLKDPRIRALFPRAEAVAT